MKKTLLSIYAENELSAIYSSKIHPFFNIKRGIILAIFMLLLSGVSQAQVINEGFEEAVWAGALTNPANSSTTSGSVVIGATSAKSTMTYFMNSKASSTTTSVTATTTGTKTASSKSTLYYTSSGLNTSPNSGIWWYSKGNTTSDAKLVKVHSDSHSWEIGSGGYLITPIIPAGITTITCWVSPGENFFIGANMATNNVPLKNYNSSSTSNGFSYGRQTFASSATSTMQSYSYSTFLSNIAQIGFFNGGNNNLLIDDINISVEQGNQATATTITFAAPTGYTSATVVGSINSAATQPAIIISSGVCYSTTATLPDTTNSFTIDYVLNGQTYGPVNSLITGLTPGTAYYARVYTITTAGIVYAPTAISFTTKSPAIPTVQTNAAGTPSSTQGTINGAIVDSGGLSVYQSGFYWGTSPTLTTYQTTMGGYPNTLTGLSPNNTYYYQAYAINSLGTGTGAILSFKTADSTAAIYATSTSINFGTLNFGSNDLIYKDTIFGRKLTPPVGNPNDSVTVTAPTGFLISLSPNGVFTSSVNIGYNYANGVLSNTVIYIKMLGSVYGIYNNVPLVITGGSADPTNIQSVYLSGVVTNSSNTYSNVGAEFWTGFGYVEEMSSNKASMSVYIAAGDQDAIVNVDIPGIGWSYYGNPISIPAHTTFEVQGFPTTTLQDSRLFFTGVSNRAVHIQSNGVPVSVWTYTSASDNTAAGCMNFPINTWNSQYTVQAFGGYSNQPYPNSYFFVIAKDDNTQVTITPTADIVDSSSNTIFKDNTASYVKYPANVPFTITLNKGQVFTGIATLSGTGKGIGSNNAFSYDLSGTKVSTDCKSKIAVFGGNARCLIDTSTIPNPPNFQTVNASSGSDNLMQQMFPNSAWGTKYLTVPTKTMEDNYYRIFVQDPKTKVTVNGFLLDTNTLVNKLYYQLSGSNINAGDIRAYDTLGNHMFEIIADKAISVTQFIVAGIITSPLIGNNGAGDPEMIILSPIQQSINSVTVATPSFKNKGNGGHYINVVIPKEGVKSFRIYADTTTTSWKAWRKPIDSAYYADPINNPKFDPTNLANSYYSYRTFSDSATMLVDTGASSFTSGTAYAQGSTFVFIDSAFQPYPTDSNYYYAKFLVPLVDPLTSQSASYTLTSSVGFNAIAYGMDNGESYGFNAGTNLKIINIAPGQPYIGSVNDSLTKYPTSQQDKSTIKSCLSIPFHFTLALSFKPDSLVWNFDVANGTPNTHISPNIPVHQISPVYDSTHKYGTDTTIYYLYTLRDASNNTIKYTFDNLNSYPVTVTAYSKSTAIVIVDPCSVDITHGIATNTYHFTIDVTKGVHPNFTPQYAKCSIDTLYHFFDNSWDENANADTSFIIGRIWNFGNGKSDTANNKSVVTKYTHSGSFTVNLTAIDKLGCIFDTTVNQSIKLKPVAKFTVNLDTICAGSSVTFTDVSTSIGNGLVDNISTWNWDYGNGTKTYSDNTARSNTYNAYGTYPVSLKIVNGAGCDSSYTFNNVYVSANPIVDFVTPNDVCLSAAAVFTNLSTIAYGHSLNYIWDFGDQSKLDSSIYTNDAAKASHVYTGDGPYNVVLTAYNTYAQLTCSTSKSKVLDVLYDLIPLQVDSFYHEGFEFSSINNNPNSFPPVAPGGQRWHVFQSPVDGTTWKRVVDNIDNIVPSQGHSAAVINNYNYTGSGQTDDLNTPVFGLPQYQGIYDSLYLKFDVAAKTNVSSGGGPNDTLEVLMSTNCQDNWVSIYKKWGKDLQTVHDGTESTPGQFVVNNLAYWRTDSINITSADLLGGAYKTILQTGADVRFKFRNHNNNENNVYLDNVNLYVIRPNGVGFYTSIIPFEDSLNIIHRYPPTNLKSISIYDMTGRLMYVTNYNNNAPRPITIHPGFNGTQYMANGMYIAVMLYTDKPRSVFKFLKQ